MSKNLLLLLLKVAILVNCGFVSELIGADSSFAFLQTECENESGKFTNWKTKNRNVALRRNNKNLTQCLRSIGIRAIPNDAVKEPRLVSNVSFQNIIGGEGKVTSGVSFMLWMERHDAIHDKPMSLLAVGNSFSKSSDVGLSACDQHHFDLHIVQHFDILEVYFRSSEQFFDPCHRILINDFSNESGIVHLVISLDDGEQRVFVNGAERARSVERFCSSLQHWNLKHVVSLLSYPEFETWPEPVYQLEIIPTSLSEMEVKGRMVQGLPPSPAFAIQHDVTLNEDAEKLAGSHEPEWYNDDKTKYKYLPQSYLRDEVSSIHLRIGSPQLQVQELLKTARLIQQNETIKVHKYITRLPEKGYLYMMNGNRVEGSENHNILIEVMSGDIVYIPPHNAYSKLGFQDALLPLDNFKYCVTDDPIMRREDCQSATVNIFVTPVNDPPVPISYYKNKVIVLYEGHESSKIFLTGKDVDKTDFVSSVEITCPPSFGVLVSSVSSFRGDGINHGTLLSDIHNRIEGPEEVYVKYMWNLHNNFSGSIHHLLHDQFSFRVADNHGSWSREETIHFEIHSALQVTDVEQVLKVSVGSVEGIDFSIGLADISGLGRPIGYFVDVVPPLGLGLLLDPVTKKVISNSTLLSSIVVGQGKLNLLFVPSSELCKHAIQYHRITIVGKAVAYDRNQRIASVTSQAPQEISVYCQPGDFRWILRTPGAFQKVLQANPMRSELDPCGGTNFKLGQTDIATCLKARVLHGIQLGSETPLVWYKDRILIEIRTSSGYLTFNKRFWNETQVTKGQRIESKGLVQFFVYPIHVENMLNSVHYQSFVPGHDIIHLAVTNGLRNSAHGFETSLDINIVVSDETESSRFKSSMAYGFPWQIFLCLFGYPMIYYIFLQLESFAGRPKREAEEDTGMDCSEWIQHETEYGDYYYENIETREVTWIAPFGVQVASWCEINRTNENRGALHT